MEGFCIISPAPENFANGDPEWMREKKWIQEVVHMYLVQADDDASKELQLFKGRLGIELSRQNLDKKRLMFDDYREEILVKHRQLKLHSLYTDHWQKKGGYSEEMLTALADSVRMRYKNMGGFGRAGDVIMNLYRVYFSYFLLIQLNDFEEKEFTISVNQSTNNEQLPLRADPEVKLDRPKLSLNKQGTVTQAQLALFYYYCHEKECLPAFPAGNMEQAYKDATVPYNLAWKPFQQHYNRFRDRDERLSLGTRNALQCAIQMLQKYPEALALAKDELRTAETRKPLT